MENNELAEKQIDDFIMGLLNQKDNQAFQLRLKEDAALAETVRLRREMISGVEAYGRKLFKNELKAIHKEVTDQAARPAKRRNLWSYVAAAASVAILVIAISWLMNQNSNQSPQELYAAYFEPYDLSRMQRSQTDTQLLELQELYKNGKYSEAIPLMENQLNKADAKSSVLLLATGISFLETNQAEKALSYFQQITQKNDFNFEDEVRWYSALAYLKLGEVSAAQNLLQSLVEDTNADHHTEAQQLLKEVK